MNFKQYFKYNLIDLLSFLFAVAFAVYTVYFLNFVVGLAELIVIFCSSLAILISRLISQKRIQGLVAQVAHTLDFSDEQSMNHFPFPILVANASGEIAWYNELFTDKVLGSGRINGNSISQFTSGIDAQTLASKKSADITFNGRSYTVLCSTLQYRHRNIYILYFVDDTELKKTALLYEQTRPDVILISVDGIDELSKSYREGELAEISSGVEKMIEDWVADYSGILRKVSSDRFIIITEEQNLSKMIEKRFSILDNVRGYTYKEKSVGVTLSIGVGCGDNMVESEANARQALEMALGRGGDQAAVKKRDLSYEFFGGVSKSVEKKTKIKARMAATAITEIINSSRIVYIMGHRFSDLDALGSSIALCSAVRALGKPCNIVLDKEKTLADTLIQRLRREGLGDMLIEPAEALETINSDSTVIIVDTHIAEFTEAIEVYEKAASVIVIDHHRLVVNHINDAVVFYHDPSTSSTSEMVTEILQYMSSMPLIGKLEADALLSGIMLDTRNFVLRAGVRTFEAAAYLRSLGADTVKVKALFSSSLDSFKLKSRVISNFQTYCGCAISVADFESPDLRIICAQAADEMLNIEDIEASFVIFENRGQINISARSYGSVNVQIIMEAFGGGGHQTMAAAQISSTDSTPEAVAAKLRVYINEFFAGKEAD